jgi:pimeloyl-ACP methyl ester carboxylesterase
MTGLRILVFVLAGLILLLLGVRFALARMMSTGGAPTDALQKAVSSKDGTVIAYEQTGAGPVIILVSAALVDRDGARLLAKELASSFTVVNYDRRGRGKSTNTDPYAPEREIEDLEALVRSVNQPVFLFGSSSGSVLALDAASRFGSSVVKTFLYEPPFLTDSSHPPIPDTLAREIAGSVAANQRDEAARLFFEKAMGIPPVGVTFMRLLMPAWKDMTAIVHTAHYDLMILAGTQTGGPLPANRWSQSISPVLIAVGAKSEPFFHEGAKALQLLLPATQYLSVPGLDHGAVLMAPKELASAIKNYVGQAQSSVER